MVAIDFLYLRYIFIFISNKYQNYRLTLNLSPTLLILVNQTKSSDDTLTIHNINAIILHINTNNAQFGDKTHNKICS